MSKKIKAAVSILSAAFLITGCSSVTYDTPPTDTLHTGVVTAAPNTGEATTAATASPKPSIPDRYQEKEVFITKEEFSQEIQLEDVCENKNQTYLMGYTGTGFIQIDTHEYATFTVHVPSTQYYRLTVYMCAFDTGVDVIIGGNKSVSSEGYETFNGVSKGIIYKKDVTAFQPFSIDGIYLKKGDNTITLQSVSGMAYMDKVKLENGRSVSDGFYLMSKSPVNPNASANTIKTMAKLSEYYGKKTLTGQKVTVGTDAEIAAIQNVTGRLPAIRQGDLSCAQSKSADYFLLERELELAKQWGKRGGLVAYGWTWYSPSDKSHYLSAMSDFDFANAYTAMDISEASLDTIEKLYGNGDISKECYRLMLDLDEIAKALKVLQQEDITVLFSPLADGGKGGYWWSDPKSCQWLWKTMVKRFNGVYNLDNIIWVWNGGSEEYFPGDEYADIVGENIYNTTGDSGNGRFMATIYYKSSKAAAMTHCLTVPDPDVLAQDNARWLWFALSEGKYLIDKNGKTNSVYTSDQLLEKAYNSDSMITLDELNLN